MGGDRAEQAVTSTTGTARGSLHGKRIPMRGRLTLLTPADLHDAPRELYDSLLDQAAASGPAGRSRHPRAGRLQVTGPLGCEPHRQPRRSPRPRSLRDYGQRRADLERLGLARCPDRRPLGYRSGAPPHRVPVPARQPAQQGPHRLIDAAGRQTAGGRPARLRRRSLLFSRKSRALQRPLTRETAVATRGSIPMRRRRRRLFQAGSPPAPARLGVSASCEMLATCRARPRCGRTDGRSTGAER
jgi:hypothetical protein